MSNCIDQGITYIATAGRYSIGYDAEGYPVMTEVTGEWERSLTGDEFLTDDGELWVATKEGWQPDDVAEVDCYGERI